MVTAGSNSIRSANFRKRQGMAWKVPASATLKSDGLLPELTDKTWTWSAISVAAFREKVIESLRLGSAPLTIRCATRPASVLALLHGAARD